MSKIQIKADELEAFADQIGKAERDTSQAINALNWHLNSLLANFPGMFPGHIEALEAEFEHHLKKYKHKLDDAQRLMKLTAASTKQSEQKMTGKIGSFLLELAGWYDIQRLFAEYDPVTGEKLSGGDKALAGFMLLLTVFPPAKAVGVGGKTTVIGTKAYGGTSLKTGFQSLAKDSKTFLSIRNVVDTQKARAAFKEVYNQVVIAPFSKTKQWFKGLADTVVIRKTSPAIAGVGRATEEVTLREAYQGAKETISRIVVGKDGGAGGVKGAGNTHTKVNYGQQYTKINGKKVLKPNIEYKTKEGYHYKSDSEGRIGNVEATLQLGKADRNLYAQRIVGREDRLPNDDGGHLIASIFKGSGDIDNLVPMDATLNRKEYKALETSWKKALEEGKEIIVKLKPIYVGNSSRPTEFRINYTIDGKKYSDRLTNYSGGK